MYKELYQSDSLGTYLLSPHVGLYIHRNFINPTLLVLTLLSPHVGLYIYIELYQSDSLGTYSLHMLDSIYT